jgi:hypothetical protein
MVSKCSGAMASLSFPNYTYFRRGYPLMWDAPVTGGSRPDDIMG